MSRVASVTGPVSNIGGSVPGVRTILERGLGIAPDRSLPRFSRQSFVSWFDGRERPRVADAEATDRVIVYPDTHTNYSAPEIGRAAVAVLESAGVRVAVPDLGPTGRAAYSLGRLDLAANRARELCNELEPALEAGWSVCFLEPSDAAMVADEYGALLSSGTETAGHSSTIDETTDNSSTGTGPVTPHERLADNATGFCEYLDRNRVLESLSFDPPDVSLAFHGHCHEKALGRDHHAVGVLRRAGYAVDPLDTGCCGMAGSFGYEAEHYDLSRAIGRLLLGSIDESDGEVVVAAGASCRTQVGDFEGHDRPLHPAEALANALE